MDYIRHYDQYQRGGKPINSTKIPLQPQVELEPFHKWGMDFIGSINPPSNQNKYIPVCIDYVIIWVKVRPMKHTRQENIASFLSKEIFTKYGVSRELVIDQGIQFTSLLIKELVKEYEIHHRKSTPYHPQPNGQLKVTNKELENILINIFGLHGKDQANRLSEAVWAYRTTWKIIIRFTPFDLMYGKKVVLPIEFEIRTLRTTLDVGIDLLEV